MYKIYNLNEIYVFETENLDLAKDNVKIFGGTVKDENDNVIFEVAEEEKESK